MTGSSYALTDVQSGADFAARHIGPRDDDIAIMLEALGFSSLEALIDAVTPRRIRAAAPLELPRPLSERNALSDLRHVARRNRVFTSMIGMGYYGTIMPKVVLRRLLESPGWYTAYTPYQAEAAQGRLEALLNFQQMVTDLTGLELANASLLDEGTAAAEAMAMARRVFRPGVAAGQAGRSGEPKAFFIDRDTHPQTIAVIRTRARAAGITVVVGDPLTELNPEKLFAALFSYPGSSGQLRDFHDPIAALCGSGALAIMATDLLALTLLKSPGELGADIAIGSAQRFGVPMGYGGPHAAFFATRRQYQRAMPGRVIGVSVDAAGQPAFRMALQTREQHIRREKATSNICTSQVLLAVIAGMYAIWHGPKGLTRIARRAHRYAQICARAIAERGYAITTSAFFDTITVHAPGQAHAIVARAREQGINLRFENGDSLGIACDETTRRSEVARLLGCFSREPFDAGALDAIDRRVTPCIPEALVRQSHILTHPVFSRHQSETALLRYLRRLQAKDIALDRSMIPLGSCTMKLNATTEMIPLSWPEFADLHPFAPLEQTQGYQQLFNEVESFLCEITGFDAVSLQPNAGSQGEYAGLLTIRSYHAARGDKRDICLIPLSAHGTNPASAVMAGLEVVTIACDERGDIDLADLEAKATRHRDRLAALMITYPSTHGVFEEKIRAICDVIHRHGGQVYLDGANLNAMVGLVRPAEFGADICHINLHKTFCIPHGGGGPGAGPIAAKAHLARFLPDHAVVRGVNPRACGRKTIGQIAAAPWGSALLMPIPWAYIAMMGAKGLREATAIAILNANYIALRLKAHFPIVYTGPGGHVAHECIIDLRQIKRRCGVTVEDVAKRLIDYGFHAPTISFPVPETIMIEPTESEDRREIDRFCDAMIAIRREISEIESGQADAQDNLLKNAPHTHAALLEDWQRPYSRRRAYFPLDFVKADKYWPPVGRIDGAYGDRNLVCSCPPVDAYAG